MMVKWTEKYIKKCHQEIRYKMPHDFKYLLNGDKHLKDIRNDKGEYSEEAGRLSTDAKLCLEVMLYHKTFNQLIDSTGNNVRTFVNYVKELEYMEKWHNDYIYQLTEDVYRKCNHEEKKFLSDSSGKVSEFFSTSITDWTLDESIVIAAMIDAQIDIEYIRAGVLMHHDFSRYASLVKIYAIRRRKWMEWMEALKKNKKENDDMNKTNKTSNKILKDLQLPAVIGSGIFASVLTLSGFIELIESNYFIAIIHCLIGIGLFKVVQIIATYSFNDKNEKTKPTSQPENIPVIVNVSHDINDLFIDDNEIIYRRYEFLDEESLNELKFNVPDDMTFINKDNVDYDEYEKVVQFRAPYLDRDELMTIDELIKKINEQMEIIRKNNRFNELMEKNKGRQTSNLIEILNRKHQQLEEAIQWEQRNTEQLTIESAAHAQTYIGEIKKKEYVE